MASTHDSPGPVWPNFETLRAGHQQQLNALLPGHAATLKVKRQIFQVMHQADFDALQDRLRQVDEALLVLQVVRRSLEACSRTPSPEQLDLLRGVLELAARSLPTGTPQLEDPHD